MYVCERIVPFVILYATLALRKEAVRDVVQPGALGHVVFVMQLKLDETDVGQ